jgi:uncharacterized damage-inducible protein DinB
MEHDGLITDYLAGPQTLRQAVAGMTQEQLDARPIPGKWSTREVVCHIADYEPVYADRMKRVIAENEPAISGGHPDAMAARLAYGSRDVEEELVLIEVVRKQMGRILRALKPEDFQRRGIHDKRGPMTLATILERVTGHIPHHAGLVEEKRKAMGHVVRATGGPRPHVTS